MYYFDKLNAKYSGHFPFSKTCVFLTETLPEIKRKKQKKRERE